ncbi:MAG: PQQ-binding-like beta-propeller repeat protein [Planctomycetota bacterium]
MLLSAALLVFLPSTQSSAADWPQYNGPDSRRAVAVEPQTSLVSKGGPEVIWRARLEAGFSSFVVSGGRAYTIDRRRVGGTASEACVAFDAATGKEIWQTGLSSGEYDGGGDAGASDNRGGDGPRSTPSVADGRIHVYDAEMMLHAIDAKTGKTVWRVDVQARHGGRPIRWQNASSPLVDDGRVYVAGGGAGMSLLAFDADSGDLVWAVGDERMTHATPVTAEIDGERQVIFYVQSGLVAVDPKTGAERWRIGFPYRTSSAASPVVHGDVVYVSAGYGVGGAAIQVRREGDSFTPEFLWHQRNRLMNHWSTPVAKDGHLYGMYGFKKYGEAPLACVELATGEIKWQKEGFGPGNVILVGEHLVALGDAGQLVVADATPAAYRERARVDVLGGKCWSSPAYAGGRVYVRSTEEGACIEL